MNNFIKIGNKKPEYYKHLLIRADEKLHEQISNEIQKILPIDSKILDLGAGQGALSLRLHHLGYKVLSVDINKGDFEAQEVPFIELDFNNQESLSAFITKYEKSFDLVLGVEVIEHLENPWDYFRNLKRLAKRQGYILVTTPNISSWYSRAVFFFTGLFPSFVDPNECGHINPISEWELQVISTKVGLTPVSVRSAGYLPRIWLSTSITKSLLSLLCFPFTFIMRGNFLGWCLLAIYKRENE